MKKLMIATVALATALSGCGDKKEDKKRAKLDPAVELPTAAQAATSKAWCHVERGTTSPWSGRIVRYQFAHTGAMEALIIPESAGELKVYQTGEKQNWAPLPTYEPGMPVAPAQYNPEGIEIGLISSEVEIEDRLMMANRGLPNDLQIKGDHDYLLQAYNQFGAAQDLFPCDSISDNMGTIEANRDYVEFQLSDFYKGMLTTANSLNIDKYRLQANVEELLADKTFAEKNWCQVNTMTEPVAGETVVKVVTFGKRTVTLDQYSLSISNLLELANIDLGNLGSVFSSLLSQVKLLGYGMNSEGRLQINGDFRTNYGTNQPQTTQQVFKYVKDDSGRTALVGFDSDDLNGNVNGEQIFFECDSDQVIEALGNQQALPSALDLLVNGQSANLPN